MDELAIADHEDGPDAFKMAVRLAQEELAGFPNDRRGDGLRVG